MPDDLRTRIAAVVARELVLQARDAGEYQTRDCYRVADAIIRELPELQPCPFCHLSHNRCDCLRTAKACNGGCMWQIPNHVEDMTPEQRKALGLKLQRDIDGDEEPLGVFVQHRYVTSWESTDG